MPLKLDCFFDRLTYKISGWRIRSRYICILVKYDHAFEKLTKMIHIHSNIIAITRKKN